MDKVQYIGITSDDDGIRLDRWFKRHYPGLPHGKLQNMLRRGEIRLNRGRANSATRIATGQIVRLAPFTLQEKTKPTMELTKKQQQALQDRVLYHDDRLIVFNKPPGLSVQGGTRTRYHLDMMLEALSLGAERPRLVHRLDKDTSGLLLLARSAAAAADLTKFFRSHQIEKTYWALTAGIPLPSEGKITAAISDRAAETEYEVIEPLGTKFAWVSFKPLTGRKHQIRIHAYVLGTPIIGDRHCDFKSSAISNKLHLHARALVLPTGERFTAPLPPHMEDTWRQLGLDETRLA